MSHPHSGLWPALPPSLGTASEMGDADIPVTPAASWFVRAGSQKRLSPCPSSGSLWPLPAPSFPSTSSIPSIPSPPHAGPGRPGLLRGQVPASHADLRETERLPVLGGRGTHRRRGHGVAPRGRPSGRMLNSPESSREARHSRGGVPRISPRRWVSPVPLGGLESRVALRG